MMVDPINLVFSNYRVMILSLLKSGPKCGYELINSIESISGKKPSHGVIYPFLKNLSESGIIKKIHIVGKNPRNKTTYAITKKGEKIFESVYTQLIPIIKLYLLECKKCKNHFFEESSIVYFNSINDYCCKYCK